jgi:hypothetical protein
MSRSVLGPVLVAALATMLIACGGDGGSDESSGRSEVALAYTEAVVATRWDDARELVAPESLEVFDRIVKAAATPDKANTDLAAGSETVDGDEAAVVLTGEVCAGTHCVNNTDPESTDPLFTVHLTEVGDDWRVLFPAPVVD